MKNYETNPSRTVPARYPGPMKYCFLLLAASLAWAQQPAPPADPVVLTVGQTKITKSQFEQIILTIPEPQRAQYNTPAGKKKLAEQLADLEAMAQEARARKLDQNPGVQAELALRDNQILAQRLFQDFMANAKPDDAALHAYYDSHKNEFDSVKCKHILIRAGAPQGPPTGATKSDQKPRSDAEALALANDLHAKIVAGGNFDELAKAFSDDTANAQSGGELGTFEHGRMVPQFEKAAFDATPGKVTAPVKTQFGYHLILVEEHKTKSFDDVKAQIEQKMRPEMAQQSVTDIRKKANIVYDDSYFGKPTPTLLPPTPAGPPKEPGK